MDAFFIDAPFGQRFCVFHSPAADVPLRGGLVYIQPFAEELNRCRRMAYLQASAFAQAGYAVLMMDLHGCGDSSGDFADATWDTWLDDVALARQWLEERIDGPVWLWGVRAGCLLAAQSATRRTQATRVLFWQPVLSGHQHLKQFLRLKLTGEMLQNAKVTGGKSRPGTDGLLAQLESGRSLEVAGYVLSPALAKGFGQATLQPSLLLHGVCLEVSSQLDTAQHPSVSTALRSLVAQSQDAIGHHITAQAVAGAAFWQMQEAPICDALISASLAAVQEMKAVKLP